MDVTVDEPATPTEETGKDEEDDRAVAHVDIYEAQQRRETEVESRTAALDAASDGVTPPCPILVFATDTYL